MMNLGIGMGVGGAAVLVSSLIWYWSRPPTLPNQEKASAKVIQPWIGKSSGGLSFGSTF
jgi:hypothetical protein